MAPGKVAAVGSDGVRPVVWGIGASEAEAREDALQWLDDDDDEPLEYLPISDQAAALVLGDGAVAYGAGEEMELRNGVLVAAGEV